MTLSTTSFIIITITILQAAPLSVSKATAETNLRDSDLHVGIIPDDILGIVRELGVVPANTTDEEEVVCHPYDLKWDDLTSEQKDAARDLSYNVRKWGNDTLPDPSAIRHDYWIDAPSGETELTTTERTAAMLLGYTEGSWEDFYSDYDWIELPKERSSDDENVKAAAKHLGFNKTTWDTNATVPTDYLDWVNLTTTEQEAAVVLGYDECVWDRETLKKINPM
eukprot:CAMPEP_0197722526 /NCGR_PEP_ID=MMETSP1434-20131217/5189_1 /TAXON_ID=265543 /ORGANISM="Minutocellus polymorphus, Strain CCMP3303" /LENGTH=222 /DNA_ID=CAMNT_0043307693 /DNA_START=41 /DNA_END=709 /DNA_ORIENTATION=-